MKHGIKNKSSLKLQSYKLDNQILAEKMNELNGLKQELESTLIKKRTEEHSIIDELSIIKSQNKRLKQQINTLKFTNKAQESLISKLEIRLQQFKNKQTLYLQQIQDKCKQKNILQNNYKQKISLLLNSQEILRQSYRKERQQLTKGINEGSSQHQSISNFIQSANTDSQKGSTRVIKRLKKPSILQPEFRHRQSISVEEKYRSKNMILQRQQDSFVSGEDIYLQAIRQLFRQLTKIGIKARDIMKIPQIQSFHQIDVANRFDFHNLFTQHPFQLKQTSKIDLVFDFFSQQCSRTKSCISGQYIIHQIISAIQQLQQNNSIFSCSRVDINKIQKSQYKQNEYYNSHRSSNRGTTKDIKKLKHSKAQSAKISIDESLRSESSLYF